MKKMFLLLLLLLTPAITSPSPPSIMSITTEDNHHLGSGTTTAILCNTTIYDSDGYENITSVIGTFYDNATTSKEAGDNKNNHYTNNSCTVMGGSENTTNAQCTFQLTYHANPSSNWICSITASDEEYNVTNESSTSTVEELQALEMSSITYQSGIGGPIALGMLSMQRTMVITNTGNVGINLLFSGSESGMNCTTGAISLANQKYDTSNGFSYVEGTSVTTTLTSIDNFTISKQTVEEIPSTGNVYWLLQLPLNGVGGNCSGNIYVDAN